MVAMDKRPRIDGKSFITFGEAMIRFAPIDDAPPDNVTRHMPQPFLRSVGGDELNVSVALSLLGVQTRWVSVIPTGPMGDILAESCTAHGVEFQGARVEGDIGTFTVLPEQRTVHYQRQNSVFAVQAPDALEWNKLLPADCGAAPWLHVTGISPLVSPWARRSWDAAIGCAKQRGVPVSLDLNHRKQLGSLEELWAMVAPHCPFLEVLVLSVDQLQGLAGLPQLNAALKESPKTRTFFDVMRTLRAMCKCKRLVVCRKTRDASGLQRRWSLLVEEACAAGGVVSELSTNSTPVLHRPKDECGGGSAWMAGFLHGIYFSKVDTLSALRRADLLSALAQETKGDFSTVTAAKLNDFEARFANVPASIESFSVSDLPKQIEAGQRLDETMALLKRSGVMAILRAKGSPEVAVNRGVELAALGCRCIEVTLDSSDWQLVLGQLRERLPAGFPLGVGTVMDDTVCELGRAAALGASFALSPIDPIGFVEECHRRGLVAVPSAFSSNEMWQLHRRGVRLIKLFHAGTISPAILKSMLDVTPLGANLNILPSGGVSPENAEAWWDAGAACVGMGSNLAGKDLGTVPGTPSHTKAVEDWQKKGKDAAKKLFDVVAQRFGSS